MSQKIVIAGGTGFLGRSLIEFFSNQPGVSLVVLTRGEASSGTNVSYVHWDGKNLGSWTAVLEGSVAVINLAGKSVNCRYTKKNKREIINSRVNATMVMGKAIQKAERPPKVWVNAGSAAIFGDGEAEIKTEYSQPGDGFSAQVCKQWEQAFSSISTPMTRKVFLRIGLVLQRNKGLFLPFVNLVKTGWGGRIGSGKQYISWVHEQDFVRIVDEAIVNESIRNIIHVCSPEPLTNKSFMQALRNSLGVRLGLPTPSFLVRLGAIFIGTEPILVLTGRRVIPAKLQELNFGFQYPGIREALRHLLEESNQPGK